MSGSWRVVAGGCSSVHATPDRKSRLPAELNEDLYAARTGDTSTQVESEGAREGKGLRGVEMRGGRTAPSLHSPTAFALSHSNRMGLGRSSIFNAHGARRTSANLESMLRCRLGTEM